MKPKLRSFRMLPCAFISAACVLWAMNSRALQQDPGNIVQNWDFSIYTWGPHSEWLLPPWQSPGGSFGGIIMCSNTPRGVGNIPAVSATSPWNVISQTLSTTVGQTYQLSFYVAGELRVTPSSSLEVLWGGQPGRTFATPAQVYDATKPYPDNLYWNEFSLTETATSSSTVLSFQSLGGTAFWLDCVQAVPVPEPSVFGLLSASLITVVRLSIRRRN